MLAAAHRLLEWLCIVYSEAAGRAARKTGAVLVESHMQQLLAAGSGGHSGLQVAARASPLGLSCACLAAVRLTHTTAQRQVAVTVSGAAPVGKGRKLPCGAPERGAGFVGLWICFDGVADHVPRYLVPWH